LGDWRESIQGGPVKDPRIAKAMQYLTQGYHIDAKAILNGAKFHEDISEMIIVKDIEIYSMCEHHVLPFLVKPMWHIFQMAGSRG
jgi:GTP cyclohydrolase I